MLSTKRREQRVTFFTHSEGGDTLLSSLCATALASVLKKNWREDQTSFKQKSSCTQDLTLENDELEDLHRRPLFYVTFLKSMAEQESIREREQENHLLVLTLQADLSKFRLQDQNMIRGKKIQKHNKQTNKQTNNCEFKTSVWIRTSSLLWQIRYKCIKKTPISA